ncbi:MAG: hypothetical protein ACREQC_02940, partial [Candidatus Binataceae bacterium]
MKLSWWLLFAALPLLLMQVGKSRAAEVVGVYALQDPGHPIPDAVLNNPNVDGVALRYPWFALERSQGAYNWGPVDREIERDAAHGKKVSITIGAGRFTPPWVLNQGVKLYSFAWRMRGAGPCREITLPVPWDPVFMSRWQDFVRAAGAHYDANPAIVAVKIQGVQSNSPELILPRDGPWGGCPNGDRNANWVRAGYTRQRVIQTWQTYANTYAAAFAHKGLVLEITPDGLPPIDDFGRLTGARSDEVGVPQIIALGMKDYASRLILQND